LRSHEDASARLARVQADALLRSDRVPVVWAYIAVEEGIHTSFPGHGPYPDAYDPRARPWYAAAVEQDGPEWGSPYVDINGLGLILPCNLALRDEGGALIGVTGLELTFGTVIRDLLVPTEVSGAEEAFLLDGDGNIVVRSSNSGARAAQHEDLSRAAELEAFSERRVVEAVADADSGSLTIGADLYTWTHLVTIDWTYVVKGSSAAMLD
ncbi:MAG: cache domain-containing protein, partial [Proteobacteria bacterium]|nr:cache domain-containing protein [Pseudomonadota bacterium]